VIIDFHTHVLAPDALHTFTDTRFQDRVLAPGARGKRPPHTIEAVLAAAEENGIDITMVSNPMHRLADLDRAQQLDTVRKHNQYVASLQEKYSNIFAFAATVPYGGEPFLREFERAIKDDGLKGAWITSSLQGSYPDDDDAFAFFQLATELDVPVVIHPPAVGFGEERLRDYRLASSIGRPMDNALAIARLIVRGIFEKLPALKLVGTHLGGGICEMIGRMDYAYNLGDDVSFLGSYEPMLINHPPSHYLRMMYLESTCYHAPAARCAVETVGAGRFLFGTDAPPLTALKKQGVELIKQLGLSPADERAVYGGNAQKLLKLPVPA
jgi:aminocarboxymuconate-semialdehyde decarboxylase